jgi:mRNA interferase MazF
MNYQWHIFWADLNPTRGSEQAGRRPVLVISEEAVNQALPVVTILPLTTYKKGRTIYPVEFLLDPVKAHLPQESIVMAHQIRAMAKTRLGEPCGYVAEESCRQGIKNMLRLYLDLG